MIASLVPDIMASGVEPMLLGDTGVVGSGWMKGLENRLFGYIGFKKSTCYF